MQLIWRMQGSNGLGFYRCGLDYPVYRYNSDDHPMPQEDDINEDVNDRLFGFRNVTAARQWFRWKSDMRKFDKNFILAAYNIDDCVDIVHGNSQTLFRPSRNVFASLLPSQLHGLCSRELHIRATKQLKEL